MTYAAADLHGCPLNVLTGLLERAGFTERDDLFVLGDVIDRGDSGIELLRWMMEQSNVTLIKGNHEAMMLACPFLFEEVTDERVEKLNADKLAALMAWMANGADPTLKGLRQLEKRSRLALDDLLDYVQDAPLYQLVSTRQYDFVLVHAGLGHFVPGKKLKTYDPHDLLWHRPELTERYFDSAGQRRPILTVFGHTPTEYYGPEYKGRILRTGTWINIDTGDNPCLLRLDDLTPFYVDG